MAAITKRLAVGARTRISSVGLRDLIDKGACRPDTIDAGLKSELRNTGNKGIPGGLPKP